MMQESNYIILVDENGQPYIAHSIFGRVKSGARAAREKASAVANLASSRAHKYIEKIGEGAKARYFYTQDELKAFYTRGKEAASRAAVKAKSAAKSGREALSSAGTKAREKARDIMGYDERERYQAAQAATKAAQDKAAATRAEQARNNEEYWETVNANGHSGRGVSPERLDKSYDEIVSRADRDERAADHARDYDQAKAYWEYAKTPLGMLDRAKESLAPATEAIKGYGKTALDKIKDLAGFDERDARDEARRAYAEADDRAHVARDEADAATRKRDAARADFDAHYDSMKEAQRSFEAAKEAVSSAWDQISQSSHDRKVAENTRDAYKQAYENMGDDFVEKIALAFSSGKREDREKAYQAFVDAGFKAADARVAEEQAWRAYKAAQRKQESSGAAYDEAKWEAGLAASRRDAAEEASSEAWRRANDALVDRAEADIASRRAEKAYSATPLGKAESAAGAIKEKATEVKEITASQARKLQEKLASGKELAQSELNQLMSFLMKGYK